MHGPNLVYVGLLEHDAPTVAAVWQPWSVTPHPLLAGAENLRSLSGRERPGRVCDLVNHPTIIARAPAPLTVPGLLLRWRVE
jgi:hypothetical protein